jgi:hypothetical protein
MRLTNAETKHARRLRQPPLEGLRLIPFKDRIRSFAAAMKELLQNEEEQRGSGIAD